MRIKVDPEYGQLQHYRKDCAKKIGSKRCDKLKTKIVKDTRVLRHLETVIKETNIALENINFD